MPLFLSLILLECSTVQVLVIHEHYEITKITHNKFTYTTNLLNWQKYDDSMITENMVVNLAVCFQAVHVYNNYYKLTISTALKIPLKAL